MSEHEHEHDVDPEEIEAEEIEAGDIPPEGEVDDPDLEAIAEHEARAERALQDAHRGYLTAVAHHYGEDAPIFPCHVCETRGYVMVDMRQDPRAQRCEDCAGLGLVVTGSLVDGNSTRRCTNCHGAGFVEPLGAVPSPPAAVERSAPVEGILPPSAFPIHQERPVEVVA